MGRMFDTPVLPRLSELLREVRDGTIQVPEFQRGYVWSDDARLRLMDSIWQGIPIGSLLVWRTGADKGIKAKKRIGPCPLPAPIGTNVRSYLVDGLQRVTTLYAALMPLPEGLERDEEGRRWPIYFDLAPKPGDDLRFQLRHGEQAVPPTWMPLSCVLDDDLFFEFRERLVEMGDKGLLQEARRLESRFRDYVVPVVPLVSDDQALVTEAFSRVNSLGQELDEGDMAHAQTLGGGFSFNDELATVTEQLSSLGWEGIERKTLIGALKAIWKLDIYKSGATGLKSKLDPQGREQLRRLPETFAPVAQLLQTFGVYGPGSLPYAYQLVALIRAAHELGAERLMHAAERLRRWFFWTTYQEHFTGMTSGQLKREFERVEALVRGEHTLDWVGRPVVTQLSTLRPNAVRSRAAILVMAIAGDRQGGGSQQQRLYGARGTDGLHRLFAEKPADDPANRVLARDEDLMRLRAWAAAPVPLVTRVKQLALFAGDDLEDLLRRNLLDSLDACALRSPEAMLRARAERLWREEQAFVDGLDEKPQSSGG